MDIAYLLSFKDFVEVQNFSLNIIDSNINSNLYKNYYKNDKNKYLKKPFTNPIKKELASIPIVNKFNLIFNKLSETNFNNIIIEFIENINFLTVEEYEEFQKTLYLKIISEINFINSYLRFIELINYVYNNVLNYNLNYLLELVNIKFELDYLKTDFNNEKYNFILELTNNDNRINNIILIKNLYNYELISHDLYQYYENILLDYSQNKYISDIFYWKPIIDESNIIKLKNILSNNLNIRDKILIENLLNNDNKIELDYVIDEYCINLNYDKFFNHITTSDSYKDNISKINLCKKILELHLEKKSENILLNLLKKLINNKILHKNDILNSLKLIKNIKNNNILEFFS